MSKLASAISKAASSVKSSTASSGGTPMVFPYTITAQIAQYPWIYEFKRSWMFRYVVYSIILTQPLWWYLQKKTNNPEFVAAWEAKKRADHEKEKKAHMWIDIEGRNANK